MKVKVASGQHEGKIAEVIQTTQGMQTRLCGGETSYESVTALVEGILYPVEFSPSELDMELGIVKSF